MRRLACLIAVLLALPVAALAQQGRFTVAERGCVNPGRPVTLAGAGMGSRQVGDIVIQDRGVRLAMRVLSWGDRRLRVSVPSSRRLRAGQSYEIVWQRERRIVARFGAVTLCAGGGGRVATRPAMRAARDEVPAPDGSPEHVVSVTQAQAGAAAAALQGQGAQLLRTRALPSLGRVLLVFALPGTLSRAQAQAVLDAAANGADIDVHSIYAFAAGPRLYAAAAIGDDPARVCRLPRAVRVGLIDGPVNPGHAALRGVPVARTSVIGARDRPPSTEHGTAVAALVAGNGAGSVAGFANGARIYAASAFSSGRNGTGAELEHVAAALDWLTGQGVRIVNMSFAGRANAAFQDILSAAARQGVVMIAASGNDGKALAAYPAGAPEVIAVTAVDARGKLYGKANRGKHIEFAAPGVDVYTAKAGGGGYQTGTSYAAPIVTALVSRQAARGGTGARAARAALRRGVRDLGPGGRDTSYGWGLVQTGGC